ncbi:MAG: hypothetical protein HY207_11935 [Nitrospirae bacterium]|nr:hypothetical protein [Nitrospirota bacterium]
MLFDLLSRIGFWLIYFSLIFLPLRWFYDRAVGPPPPEKPGDRLRAWTERQVMLRRRFIAAGVGLALLPLLMKLVVALSRG